MRVSRNCVNAVRAFVKARSASYPDGVPLRLIEKELPYVRKPVHCALAYLRGTGEIKRAGGTTGADPVSGNIGFHFVKDPTKPTPPFVELKNIPRSVKQCGLTPVQRRRRKRRLANSMVVAPRELDIFYALWIRRAFDLDNAIGALTIKTTLGATSSGSFNRSLARMRNRGLVEHAFADGWTPPPGATGGSFKRRRRLYYLGRDRFAALGLEFPLKDF